MATTLRVTARLESRPSSLSPDTDVIEDEESGDGGARLDFVSVTIICGVIVFCVILCMIIGCRRKKRPPPRRCQDVVAATIDQSHAETDGAGNIQRNPGSAPNRSRGDDSPPPTYSVLERQTSFTSSVSQTSSMIEVPPIYDDTWESSDAELDTSGRAVGRSASAARGPRWSQRHADRSGSLQSGRRTTPAAERSDSLPHSRPPRAPSHRYNSDAAGQARHPVGSRRDHGNDAEDDSDEMSEVMESDAERAMDVIAEVTPRSSLAESRSSADQSKRTDTQSTLPLLADAGQLRTATAV